MNKIINHAQSAFIPGRSIADNVLLSHDLVRSFHLSKGTDKICIKVDLSKAFHSVRRDFVEAALKHFNFPPKLSRVIMACIHSPAFSILVNGKTSGFFNYSRGLRQGYLISPYIFCLVMEYLSAMLTESNNQNEIRSPFNCNGVCIFHLLFADGVLIFAKDSSSAAANFKMLLQVFHDLTGLSISNEKSVIIFSNADSSSREVISSILCFKEKTLPLNTWVSPFFQLGSP